MCGILFFCEFVLIFVLSVSLSLGVKGLMMANSVSFYM